MGRKVTFLAIFPKRKNKQFQELMMTELIKYNN